LAAALVGRELPKDIAKVGLRVARGTGNPHDKLIAALTAAGGIAAESKPLTPKEMEQLVKDIATYGDPARGEALFRRKDQQCFNCHAIAGAGGRVGPDLVSLGASAPVDYLVNSLLQPNDKIKENYHTVIVTTAGGDIFSGVKVRETDEHLILRDKDDKEVSVPLAMIDEQAPGRSLMPDGMAETLTRAELIDLVRFLSELGKVGPYQVGQARLVRRWESLLPTEEGLFVLRRTGFQTAAAGDPKISWGALYSTVAGELPLEDAHTLAVPMYPTPVSFVRCELEVTTPGEVKLALNDPSGLTAWLGPEPVTLEKETTLDLPRGRHRLTIVIDRDARREALRLELMDVKGSPAQAQVVGGK
jgi:putative heme-binding domain-containing protein